MKFSPEIFSSTIVAIGAFNPAIFSPDWLLTAGLIGEEDRNAANLTEGLLISKQVSAFETDWFGLQVLEDRFTLASKGALSPAFRDLAQGILGMVPHTPVSAVGLNFIGHYPVGTEEIYHRVGDALAPKDIWRKALPGKENLGLADLQIFSQPGKRGDPVNSMDRLTFQVQPSSKIRLGIFLSLNDHRADAFDAQKKSGNALDAAGLIESDWEKSWAMSVDAFENILNAAVGE